VLDVPLRFAKPRERYVQLYDAVHGPSLQLFTIQIVLLRMPAAEEQHRAPERFAAALERFAFL
jgi:hypothetical protein